ncbi:hypothetical protein RY831_28930 [Noviherbaspirillum sp. CPCC 100848]|uniref:Uncharacterized protein n=1 Tax=Noviherbaspirillum album TaxID=3080276 RepID=A0ABU6JHP3_9BURK|nr:hypothetical protein [Noviherbaspirillum sp. CPCC 100848]MEC4723188.1 hypothetical protein [Noviherbaspirillum sp. CPCC 100848]
MFQSPHRHAVVFNAMAAYLALAFAGQPLSAQARTGARVEPSSAQSERTSLHVSQKTSPDPVDTAINTTVADIARNPRGYEGRNVAVNSKVEEIYSPWSIRLDEQQLFAGGIDNDILVVSNEPLALLGFDRAWRDRTVKVTGTVRILQAEDFRHEASRDSGTGLAERYTGKPAIIAASIVLIE